MNILRFLSDVKYDLLVPPLGLDFVKMTTTQAQENFDWFISKIPERIEYLSKRCADDMKMPIGCIDYSLESLDIIWK